MDNDTNLQELYDDIGLQQQTLNLGNKQVQLLAMKFNENNPEDMKHIDQEMICLWCGRFFNSYDQYVENEMNEGIGRSWLMYCSDRCFYLDQKYGKIKEALRTIPRYLVWKPYFRIQDWYYSEFCPTCFQDGEKLVKLRTIIAGHLYCCDVCDEHFEMKTMEHKHHTIKQGIKKIKRMLYYIGNGGKSAVVLNGKRQVQ